MEFTKRLPMLAATAVAAFALTGPVSPAAATPPLNKQCASTQTYAGELYDTAYAHQQAGNVEAFNFYYLLYLDQARWLAANCNF